MVVNGSTGKPLVATARNVIRRSSGNKTPDLYGQTNMYIIIFSLKSY